MNEPGQEFFGLKRDAVALARMASANDRTAGRLLIESYRDLEEIRSLVVCQAFLSVKLARLLAHVASHPDGTPAGAEDIFAWLLAEEEVGDEGE